ncbi:MAG: beta-N-acetylhexosaminidase [Pseudomonadota bacterium]
MSFSKAMIVGCAGKALSADEVEFFKREQPWGFILFARNIGSRDEIISLTSHFRELVGRDDAPVFIDQEGGRVQRIKAPLAPNYPTGRLLGELYDQDKDNGIRSAREMSRLHAADLLPLGINADCLPVLDVPQPGSHDVIGDRAYGHSPQKVADMGRAAADGLIEGGVLPVIKHIPGHGRAMVDSHHALPLCDTPHEELSKHDFEPFCQLARMPMAMTAHVVYAALDEDNPATTSRTVIDQVIRGEIGFDGLLMTDDLSMKALSGDFQARTKASFAAGCDVVLHCNGVMQEMAAVAEATPHLSGKAEDRAERAMALVQAGVTDGRSGDDIAALRRGFEDLISVPA